MSAPADPSVHPQQRAGVAEAVGVDQLGAGDLDAVEAAVEGAFPEVQELCRTGNFGAMSRFCQM